MFLPGVIGKFLSFIPITVFSTLLAALILSLTLSSAIFIKIMKSKKSYHKDKKLEYNLHDTDLLILNEERK
jgi:multidrug efflux pump subunit AcrB